MLRSQLVPLFLQRASRLGIDVSDIVKRYEIASDVSVPSVSIGLTAFRKLSDELAARALDPARPLALHGTPCPSFALQSVLAEPVGSRVRIVVIAQGARHRTPATFTREVALQIAAMNPMFVRKEEVDPAVVEKERTVLVAKAKESGKPEAIAQKMVEGQITKWMKEICLLDQPWVKDGDKTIDQVQQELIAKIGENIKIRRFVRFELGEGLEKKKDDFAAEVVTPVTIQAMLSWLVICFLINATGAFGVSIANSAHLAGLLFGWLLGQVVVDVEGRADPGGARVEADHAGGVQHLAVGRRQRRGLLLDQQPQVRGDGGGQCGEVRGRHGASLVDGHQAGGEPVIGQCDHEQRVAAGPVDDHGGQRAGDRVGAPA